MKKSLIFLVLVVLTAALIAGCAGQKAESVLDKIKTSGKVVVGTSADYAPYEFVDDAGKITGFDVELMEEIAKRMGVELVWTDMPFDSLIAAVQEGKIDMSISCFNYSEERDAQVPHVGERANEEGRGGATEDDRHEVERTEARAAEVRRDRVGDPGPKRGDRDPDREHPCQLQEVRDHERHG